MISTVPSGSAIACEIPAPAANLNEVPQSSADFRPDGPVPETLADLLKMVDADSYKRWKRAFDLIAEWMGRDVKLRELFLRSTMEGFRPFLKLTPTAGKSGYLENTIVYYRKGLTYSKYAATKAAIETATSDLAQIGYWIHLHHGDPLNWHAATGASVADGAAALEVHGDHGRMALCQACQDDWDWIDTLRSLASDSTRYLFFRWPAGLMMRRSVMQIGSGLILHGEGSSVPIPPSRSASGIDHVYLSPQAALASTPEWLIRVALQGSAAAAGFRRESTCDWDASSAA